MATERAFRSSSVEATEALAEALGRGLRPGDVIALEGELGSGKTAFVRGLARGMGVLDPVHSPTFALLNEYAGPTPLLHFDAWMEGREAGFLESGGAQLLGGEGVCAIEWAERIAAWLPERRLSVRLHHEGPGRRRIVLQAAPGAEALEGVLAALTPTAAGLEEIPPAGEPRGSESVPRDA